MTNPPPACFNNLGIRGFGEVNLTGGAMPEISRELLESYVEDALSTTETARVEQALRESPELRRRLRNLMQELDRGEHSLGAIWRRQRLTCPSREQLGSYLLQALEADLQDYIAFHLDVIGCAYCHANLADLKSLQRIKTAEVRQRRRRFFESSAGLLSSQEDTPGGN